MLQLAEELNIPYIPNLVTQFLFGQQQKDNDTSDSFETARHNYLWSDGKIKVFNLATALFYVSSDVSGIYGMRWEIIRSTLLWRNKGSCYDCVFIKIGRAHV